MPELPEVETVRSGLERLLADRPRIAGVYLGAVDLRRPFPKTLRSALTGQPLLGVRRRAKYLLLDTEKHTLINHLGMTGTWRVFDGAGDKHDHFKLELDDGRVLVYRDPRRFGLVLLSARGKESKNPWLENLGVEPLDSAAFTGDYLYSLTRQRKAAIKPVLMDQKIVVGVGNIYASEALHRAGISPGKRASLVSKPRLAALTEAVREVLGEAIAAGGTTLSDFRQAGGSTGYFQRELQVYDREGEPCMSCGSPIAKKIHAQRSSYWCRKCQK